MHLYCMCQILVFNAINTIVTDMECNIRIDRLPLGRGTDQWKLYCPGLRFGQYHFHWSVPRPLGSLYYSVIKWVFSYKDCIMSEAVVLGRGQLYRPEATPRAYTADRGLIRLRGHNTVFI
jgi:hypothetical protein